MCIAPYTLLKRFKASFISSQPSFRKPEKDHLSVRLNKLIYDWFYPTTSHSESLHELWHLSISPCWTLACPLWKKWKASEALGFTCFTTGKIFRMSSSVKAGLWRLSKLYSFIRIWKVDRQERSNQHLSPKRKDLYQRNKSYLNTGFDWNLS